MNPLLYQLGVKGVILNANQDILLLKRDNPNAPEGFYWDLPGGLVEEEEEPLTTLSREIYEETGIRNLKIGELIHTVITDNKINLHQSHRILMVFLCGVSNVSEVSISSEHSAFSWMKYQDAAAQLVRGYNYDFTDKLRCVLK